MTTSSESLDLPAAPRLSPTALSIEDAARLWTKLSGQPITVQMIDDDLLAGAPSNPDGTLNLVHFTAWMVRELGRGRD